MIYQSQSRDIRMLLAGEVMPSRHLTPFTEPDYLAAIELIRAADVGFTNLETVVRTRHEGTPAFTRGTPMTTPPVLLDDLKWMGFNLLSTANNHMGDFGPDGRDRHGGTSAGARISPMPAAATISARR